MSHAHAGADAAGGQEAHSHAGGGHSHVQVSADTDSRRLAVALALIVVFMAGEVVVGILAHSLALLSDAAHMLTDAGRSSCRSLLSASSGARRAATSPSV